MRKPGKWGGNIEIQVRCDQKTNNLSLFLSPSHSLFPFPHLFVLQAASMLYTVNIHIYQLARPRWDVSNHPPTARVITLSYHDGDHYNSVHPISAKKDSNDVKLPPVTPSSLPKNTSENASIPSKSNGTGALSKKERAELFKKQQQSASQSGSSGYVPAEYDPPTDQELEMMTVRQNSFLSKFTPFIFRGFFSFDIVLM